jgi:hypothetical protein
MFGLTTLTAVYFSVAKGCGHLSAAIAALAISLLILSLVGKWFKRHTRALITAQLLAGCALWCSLCDRVETTYYCPQCQRAVVTDVYRVFGVALARKELVSRTIDGKMVMMGSCRHPGRELGYEIRYWGLVIPQMHVYSRGTRSIAPFWDSGCGAINEFASLSRLGAIGDALARYRAANGTYPPQYVADKDGRPMHSWRVLLLPYLGSDAASLYNQYDMTQPWDAPKNRVFARQIPSVYTSPYDTTHRRIITPYVAVSGEHTLWPGARAIKMSDISDDPSKRIAIVEAANSDIEWTEPRDIPFSQAALGIRAGDGQGIRSYRASKIPVLLASGDRAWIPVPVPTDLLKALLTIAGSQRIERACDPTFADDDVFVLK